MRVLSLFDGISCARVALDRAGIPVEVYYASEIDKYAIQIAQKNYPDTIQLGDIVNITKEMVKDIDLIIGGSPCQDLSIAKKGREGLQGSRSGLFYEFVRLVKEIKPKYFILENVNSMPKEAKQMITDELWSIEPVMINAALVSAQNRKRLFWVGKLVGNSYEQVKIEQPEDKGILLKDILEDNADGITYNRKDGVGKKIDKSHCLSASDWRGLNRNQNQTAVSLSANGGGWGAKTGPAGTHGSTPHLLKTIMPDTTIRKLTPIECERLQSLPDNYTEGVSNTQRYKALGNAFNVDVIVHILKTTKGE